MICSLSDRIGLVMSYSVQDLREYKVKQQTNLTNPTMHLSHIPYVGYGTGALWDLCNSSMAPVSIT